MMLCAPARPLLGLAGCPLPASAHHVEEHVFERLAAIGLDQRLWRAVLDDAARIQQNDAISEALDLRHVVRSDQQGGAAALGVSLELLPDPVGGVGIERGGRLVKQKQLGRIEQGLGEADTRLLAGRKLARGPVEQRLDLQIVGDIGDALDLVGDAVKPGINGEVLPHREPHRQVDIRALEIHPMRDSAAVAGHIRAENAHLARGRHDEAKQHGDGRGLAGAIAAEQPDRRGGLELEADMVYGLDDAVSLDQIAHDHGHGGANRARSGNTARTANSFIHDLALLVSFVGIMARAPYGRLHL